MYDVIDTMTPATAIHPTCVQMTLQLTTPGSEFCT